MLIGDIEDPVTGENTPATLARFDQGRGVPEIHGHRRLGVFGPEAEFFIFDVVRATIPTNEVLLCRFDEGPGNRAVMRERPQPRLQATVQGRLFSRPADGPFQDMRTEMMLA